VKKNIKSLLKEEVLKVIKESNVLIGIIDDNSKKIRDLLIKQYEPQRKYYDDAEFEYMLDNTLEQEIPDIFFNVVSSNLTDEQIRETALWVLSMILEENMRVEDWTNIDTLSRHIDAEEAIEEYWKYKDDANLSDLKEIKNFNQLNDMLENKTDEFRWLNDKKIFSKFFENEYVVAYHCGSKPPSVEFEVGPHLFSGEGEGILGPGIYFAGVFSNEEESLYWNMFEDTAMDLAIKYCKYAETPYLYRVHIKTKDLYDRIHARPEKLHKKIQQAVSELPEKIRSYHSTMRHGYADLGLINAYNVLSGKSWKETLKKYKEIGVKGQIDLLPKQNEYGARVVEIVVYDPSIIESVEYIPRNSYNY